MIRKINYAAINPDRVKELEYIDQQLENAGYGYIPRLAILGNIQQESSGNPLAISNNGAWHGIIQWNKDRYRLQNRNPQDELQRQTSLLLKELEKTGWSGATWRDQLQYAQSFKDSTDLRQAVDIFTRRFVRPANIELEVNKRYAHAQKGWMDEEQETTEEPVVRKPLQEKLININPLINNRVSNPSSNKQTILPRNKPKVLQIPKHNPPTEQEIQDLIYNSFKYQSGGNLIYHEFKPETEKYRDETNDSDLLSDLIFTKAETFPTSPVSDWDLSSFARDWHYIVPTKKWTVQYSNGINVGNMQELVDLMQEEGISCRITSGFRANAVTSNGSPSHHSYGNALDIIPAKGQSWDDLINQMKRSNRFIEYMREHGLGILDERSKEMQAKTGATGPHFHIGPDQSALSNFKLLFG